MQRWSSGPAQQPTVELNPTGFLPATALAAYLQEGLCRGHGCKRHKGVALAAEHVHVANLAPLPAVGTQAVVVGVVGHAAQEHLGGHKRGALQSEAGRRRCECGAAERLAVGGERAAAAALGTALRGLRHVGSGPLLCAGAVGAPAARPSRPSAPPAWALAPPVLQQRRGRLPTCRLRVPSSLRPRPRRSVPVAAELWGAAKRLEWDPCLHRRGSADHAACCERGKAC